MLTATVPQFGYGVGPDGEVTYNGRSCAENRRKWFRRRAWLYLEGPAARARKLLQALRDDVARGVELCAMDKLRAMEAQRVLANRR